MRRLSLTATLLVALAGPAMPQTHLGSYTAWIGPQDLVNSNGRRLSDAAQILRQDRANVHRFGQADPGDSGDAWFHDANARAALDGALQRGIDAVSRQMIVQGGIWVQVDVYGRGSIIQGARANAYR